MQLEIGSAEPPSRGAISPHRRPSSLLATWRPDNGEKRLGETWIPQGERASVAVYPFLCTEGRGKFVSLTPSRAVFCRRSATLSLRLARWSHRSLPSHIKWLFFLECHLPPPQSQRRYVEHPSFAQLRVFSSPLWHYRRLLAAQYSSSPGLSRRDQPARRQPRPTRIVDGRQQGGDVRTKKGSWLLGHFAVTATAVVRA